MDLQTSQILFLSGVHGNEKDIIPFVKKNVEKYKSHLLPYLYISEASPTAVKQGTRENAEGYDLNRSFTIAVANKEAYVLMETLRPHAFDICFDFHEDPGSRDLYVYDYGVHTCQTEIRAFLDHAHRAGFSLFNGIDDPNDMTLGLFIKDGYNAGPGGTAPEEHGFMGSWMLKNKITKDHVTIEIPGLLPLVKKGGLVDMFFKTVILPRFSI